MPSAALNAEAPTESTTSQNGPCGLAAARPGPSTISAPHSATAARCSSRRTCPQPGAPPAAASWQARCPTPPEAPSTSTLRPSRRPPWRSACSAVSPATGKVAASASLTPSGKAATAWLRQLTRSAQAPDGSRPTTLVPRLGPLPSAASVSTTPAKSHPGRQPASATCKARRVSPRFSEIAVTLTPTSSRSGSRNSTGLIASFPGAAGSTTTARICCGISASLCVVPRYRLAADDDLAGGSQSHQIDRADIIGRSRVIGRHRAAADLRGAIPMPEREVIGAGRGDHVVADQPGWAQRVGPGLRRLVMAVANRDLPPRQARRRLAQRHHVVVVTMRVAPEFEVPRRKRDHALVGDAEYGDVADFTEPAAQPDRVRAHRIVIAGQDHHRQPGIGEQLAGT